MTHVSNGGTDDIFWIQGTRMLWFKTRLGPEKRKKKKHTSYIREYGSTLYVGMVRVVSFSPYIGIGAKFRIRLKIAKTRLCRVEYRTNIL